MSSAGVRAGGAFIEIFAKDGAFQAAMRRIETKMRTIGTAMRQVGTNMAMGAGAVGAPMVMAVRQFAGFDDAMRAAGAAAQANDQQFAAMAARAEELGLKFGESSTNVAMLMTELGRAGFKPDQINVMTESVLALAKATGTDAAMSAGIVSATLAQFSMGAGEAARIADVLTLAANATFNSVEGLGEALQYVGPVAADVGMSLEETVAVLGTLGNLGIQGSEAGTAMRRLLTITGADAKKLQEIFGVSFLDAAGNVRPLVDTLGEVAAATNGLSSGERVAKFNEAFGLLGITSARAIGKAAADTRQLEQQLMNASGTASAQAAYMEAGVGGAFRRLVEGIRQVANSFGSALAPALTTAAGYLTGFAAAVKRLIADNPILSQVVAGVTAAIFGFGVAAIAGGFALQTMAAGIRGLSAVLQIMPALCNPVGLAIMGIAAAVAATTVIARQLSPAFREETDAIAAALMSGNITGAFDIVIGNLAIGWMQASQAAEDAMDAMANGMTMVGSLITDTLIGGLDSFMGLFGKDILDLQSGWEKLGVFMRAAWDWDFWTNGMQAALDEIDARTKQAREELPTAEARAAARTDNRQRAADDRGAANAAREARQAAELREARAMLDEAHQRVKAATTDSAKTDAETTLREAEKRVNDLVAKAGTGAGQTAAASDTAASQKGFVTASPGFGGTAGLGIGPELGKLEQPARETADNTAQIAASIAAQNAEVAQLTAQADATPSALDAVVRGEAIPTLSAVGDSAATQAAVAAIQEAVTTQAAAQANRPPIQTPASAVANTAAASSVPAAAAQTAAGTRSATETQSLSTVFANGVKAIVSEIRAHAQISAGQTGLLQKIVENTGKAGEVFA